jgi:hypothetical protein
MRNCSIIEYGGSTKHPKKNENYNEILKKPFIFNLQTVSMTRRSCCSSLSRPNVIGCKEVRCPYGEPDECQVCVIGGKGV